MIFVFRYLSFGNRVIIIQLFNYDEYELVGPDPESY